MRLTVSSTELTRPAGTHHAVSSADLFRVSVTSDWAQAEPEWREAFRDGVATPFQHPNWLGAWYRAFAVRSDVLPVILTVSEAASGVPTVHLPLIRRVKAGVRIVEFADLGLTDYNAPILGPAAPRTPEGARALWRELRRAMPGDLIRFVKMPTEIGGKPNPLAYVESARPSSLNGNPLHVGEDYDAFRYSLAKVVRKELERSWRVFCRHPQAAFRVITDPSEAQLILAIMEAQQAARMQEVGQAFPLAEESSAAFYRNLVSEGLRDGYAVLTALTAGEEIVAALLGIRGCDRYVMVRISNAGEGWANCSPGRLVIERTMAWLHREGCRVFDFSVGNYAYKRRFGVEPMPLVDLTSPLTWRGLPGAARAQAARWSRRHPMLHARLRRMVGKPPSREEA